MLNIENIKKTFKNIKALDDVSLEVKKGEFFGLLGPNGAGKTTLIGVIVGLVKADYGKITIANKPTEKSKSVFGVVPQELNVGVFEIVKDVVANNAGYHNIPRKQALKNTEEILKQLNLWDKRNNKVRDLSGGMKRRLMIAKALVHKPKLLILDEPTTGIDVELRLETWKFLEELNKSGVTIILTTHYLEEAEYLCKKLAIINKGKIIKTLSTNNLLSKICKQHLIIDIDKHKKLDNPEFKIKYLDDTVFEVEIDKGTTLNDLVIYLEKQGIKILGIKPKTSRLEQIFVELIEGDKC